METAQWLIGGGLGVGVIFGFLVQRYRLCMVAAISNWQLVGDKRYIYAFIAALMIAILGTQLLEMSGTVAINTSSYRNNQFDWLGVLIGGFIFGIGATLAGGCAARTLVRSAEGSLQSTIALIGFLIFAAITQFMFLEGPRVSLTLATAISLKTDAGLASMLGLPMWLVTLVAFIIPAGLLYRGRQQGMDTKLVAVGGIIGLLVVVSWYITGVLAQDDFDPSKPSAITVSGPLARVGYLFLSGKQPALSFAMSFIIGIYISAFISALLSRNFKITSVTGSHAIYAFLGGALMGIGGIMSYGCNVGQGLTGASTLSVESILALIAMIVGTMVAVKGWEKYDR